MEEKLHIDRNVVIGLLNFNIQNEKLKRNMRVMRIVY